MLSRKVKPRCRPIDLHCDLLPLHLVGTLCYEETLGVGLDFCPPRVDGNLAVRPLFGALDLDGQQQELQLGETQSRRGEEGKLISSRSPDIAST